MQKQSVLLVSSTRGFSDPRGTLRLQETVSALVQLGWDVDVLVPRVDPNVSIDPKARLFTVPRLPFTSRLPERPSIRRSFVAFLMFLHGAYLVCHRDYTLLHGVDDGSGVARSMATGFTRWGADHRLPYLAEYVSPFTRRGVYPGFRFFRARTKERRTIRSAAAVILANAADRTAFDRPLPLARVSVIPDPNGETAHAAFSFSDFSAAIAQVYAYAARR